MQGTTDVYRLDDTLPPEMARNSEKRLTGLNRFLEAKDREGELFMPSTRPSTIVLILTDRE